MTHDNAPSSSSRSSHGPWQPPALEEIQALFPLYEIVALLGRGGMGAVYKGWQRSLDRFVAIKILPPGLTDDPQYSERFKQEAKSMAKLSHPGIVAVFDAGETPDGMLYFVMEFIEGTDVQKMIAEQGSLPPAHAMAITAHVCDALQYAHDRSIIHRDIKPANIMVGYDGVVKVADFGLAKQQQEGVSGLTQSGMVMGTLHYLAPEALILGLSVDHRADIYAVGIMLYQMLTGRLPQGLFEMPSQKVQGLDPRYDAVVAKAIREDRDIRYQSAAELRADLDSILTQPVVKVDPAVTQAPAALPTVARPQRPQGYVQRTPQPVPKKSSSTSILLVAVLVLAAGGFFVFKDKLPPGAAPEPTQPVTAETLKADPAIPAPPVEETVKKDAAPTTPAATTGRTARMPEAVPKTKPVAPKPAIPQTELEKRIATLETGFQNAAKAEPEQVFQQSMAALNKSYLAALDRSLTTATQKGELDDAVALREEKQRMENASSVPSLLEESTLVTPVRETLKKLRDTYRATQLQHATTKAKAVAALYDKYDQALAAIQAELTKGKKLDEALTLKPARDQISQRKAAVLAMTPAAVAVIPNSAAAVPSSGFTNSLGMKFVLVPGTGILMCIYETRRQDYAKFAAETPSVSNYWQRQMCGNLPCGDKDEHPVVGVSWVESKQFCDWLSKQENRVYRLPTDEEWSRAVGIGDLESRPSGVALQALSQKEQTQFPWGGDFPPKSEDRAGNYADSTWHQEFPDAAWFENYTDGYATTAPVGSFKPNKLGLHDMGGNVWEWVEEWWNAEQKEHSNRGGSFFYNGGRGNLLSSNRGNCPADARYFNTGFRVVVKVVDAALASSSAAAPSIPAGPALKTEPSPAAPGQGLTNSLGMKFVPVPDTETLMCIHETRRQDYAAFAAADAVAAASNWKREVANDLPADQEGRHPVTGVNFNHAQAFCAWLSAKEGRLYRLPTDREWSQAVGLGQLESPGKGSPAVYHNQVPNQFPWGNWPPNAESGNYRDLSSLKAFGNKDESIKVDYDDGFPMTAPVMSFKPNAFGIYDLGGNVIEWCDDWYDDSKKTRVLRGGSWYRGIPRSDYLSSSFREHSSPEFLNNGIGFRVVVNTRSSALELSSSTASKPAAAPVPPVKPAVSASAASLNMGPELTFFGIQGEVRVIDKDGQETTGGVAAPPQNGVSVTHRVTPGNSVRTGKNSTADMIIAGGGSLRLDPGSQLLLPAIPPSGTASDQTIELVKGRLLVHFDATKPGAAGSTELRLKTPAASLSIKNAKGYFETSAGYDRIVVLQGSVEITESKSGSRLMLAEDMTAAVKLDAISPPQRASMAQRDVGKACDLIELVRTELPLTPLDEIMEQTFDDNSSLLGAKGSISTKHLLSWKDVASPSSKATGTLMTITPDPQPNVRSRTISYLPKLDMASTTSPILAVEIGFRSDGITQVAPGVEGHDPESGLFAITPFQANYVYHIARRIYLDAGNGSLGGWTRKVYPLYAVPDKKLKFIRLSFYLYLRDDQNYFVPGRLGYQLEVTPAVIITRKSTKQRP